jgi:hypothetical protein
MAAIGENGEMATAAWESLRQETLWPSCSERVQNLLTAAARARILIIEHVQ